jgi:hypothetical protein
MQDKLFSPSPQATSLPTWFREHAVNAHVQVYVADVLHVFRDQSIFNSFSRFALRRLLEGAEVALSYHTTWSILP